MPNVPSEIAAQAKKICLRGGFPESYLAESMTTKCSPAEQEWVRNYRKLTTDGLCLVGEQSFVDTRMMLMAAAFTRNFITARVVTVYRIVEDLKDQIEDFDACTVLLIPNLYVRTHGKALTGWQAAGVHDLLLQRLSRGLKTVAYIESLDLMESEYGKSIPDLMRERYEIITPVQGGAV